MTLEEKIPILMVLNGAGVPGRLIPMYLADRYFRPIHVGLPINLMTALLLFVWISIKSTTSMYVFAVVYGLFASALQGLFPATMADLTVDPKKTGTRFGMGFALSSFGVLIGSPAGGALIEYKHGDYLYAQVFADQFCIHAPSRQQTAPSLLSTFHSISAYWQPSLTLPQAT
jgi:predicted MFS family arabinose efflux permease